MMKKDIKIKIRDIADLIICYTSFDGFVKETIKNSNNETVRELRDPYILAGSTRWSVVENLLFLKEKEKAYTQSKDGIINEVSGGSGKIEPTEKDKLAQFNKKHSELLNQEIELKNMNVLTKDNLNLDRNPLPAEVITFLMGFGLVVAGQEN